MRLLTGVVCLIFVCGQAFAEGKRLYNTEHWPPDAVEMWDHLQKALGYTYKVDCANVMEAEAAQGCREEKDAIQQEIRDFMDRIESAAHTFANGDIDAYESIWPSIEEGYPDMFSSAKGFRKAYPIE